MIFTKSSADFSPCKLYRYSLERWWSPFAQGRAACFCMLNPSTADQEKSDPTVARCIGFAQSWGFDGLIVTNIFAYRSTDPAGLTQIEDPIGPDNNEYIQKIAKQAAIVVCAWGIHGALMDRGRQVIEMLTASEVELYCLGVTKAGQPRHPLYVKGSTKPERFVP